MNLAHDLIVDQFPPAGSEPHLATWYTQGHSDGLGDRLLMFDNTSAPSWEILRFKPALARIPAFERALRDRLAALRSFQHPVFPIVRGIDELGRDDGLAVASTYASGVRLSEALHKPRSAAFAIRLLGALLPAVDALHRHGDADMSHGALTLDRIAITADGRLAIREHMVGSALASLGLSAERLWTEFGVAAFDANDAVPVLDRRNDVVQIALIALSVMAGRRVGPADGAFGIEQLLDELPGMNATPLLNVDAFRSWLARALQLAPNAFESAREAAEALVEVRGSDPAGTNSSDGGASVLTEAAAMPIRGPRLVASRPLDDAARAVVSAEPDAAPVDASATRETAADRPATRTSRLRTRLLMAFTTGVAIVAAIEAVVIGRNLVARPVMPAPAAAALSIDSPEPGTQVWVDGQLVGSTPLELKIDPRIHSVRLRPPDAAAALPSPVPTPENATKTGDVASRPAVTVPKSGGLQLTSSVDLYVMEGERLLGASSDGPIFAPAGPHDLDFVNTSIGFRTRRTVTVRAGQISSMSIVVPNGALNINAVPWASVWVDGNAVGDTPIGNLAIAPGQHEILFKNPQFGERREKTVVRADGPTRVTMNLQR